MSEPFLGEIRMFGGNFAPRGWALCNGQLLAISQNTALFSILGTTYGGNGTTTFGLPDLRGRSAVHPGQGSGLSNFVLGEMAGTETVSITQNQMPMHNHLVNATINDGNQTSPAGGVLSITADNNRGEYNTYSNNPANATLSPQTISVAGGSQPLPIQSPFLCVNFIIALQGIFPSRN